jgi:uncharacterized repeat protein (TIGR01451 family)
MGPEANGNDYAIDDIAMNEVMVPAYSPVKKAEPLSVAVGETVKYTVTLSNTGINQLTNVRVQDILPDGFAALPGTVTINGVSSPTADPAAGFAAPDIPGGGVLTVTFEAVARYVPAVNPAPNTGRVTYSYSPVRGGIPDNFTRDSNVALVAVRTAADVSVTKTADKSYVIAGDKLTYTLTALNSGPSAAKSVTVTDTLAPSLQNPEYSLDGGLTWLGWPGSYTADSLARDASLSILVRGTVSASATDPVTNTVTVSSPTHDPHPGNNSNTVLTPVRIQADLSVVKESDRETTKTGDLLTYTLTARNGGPNEAKSVTVTDNIPAGLTNPEYSTDGGATWRPWRGAYSLAALPAGGSFSILVRGTVSGSAGGILVNTAAVGSPTPDPNPANNSNTTLTPVTPLADLSVDKTAQPSPVAPGETLTYTIVVANNGPDNASNINLLDNIAPELTGPMYSIDGGATWRQWRGGYTLASLAAGESQTVQIRGTVSDTATGVLANTATVNSPTLDPDPANNGDVTITPIRPQDTPPDQTSADLSVVKTGSPGTAQPGDTITYTVTATNNGPDYVMDATIYDSIPPALTNPEYSLDGGVTWQAWRGAYSVASIPAGLSLSMLIRAQVGPTASGIIANTVTAVSPTPDPNPDNNSDTVLTPVTTPADLAVAKKVDLAEARAGDTLTYTITVANNGPNAAAGIELDDEVAEILANPEYSIDGGATWQPWNGSYSLDSLPAGVSATVLIRGTLRDVDSDFIANTATVSSSTPDPNPDNNSDTAFTHVVALADLAVTKTCSPSPVHPREILTYTLTAVNNGPDAATDVTLTDKIDSAIINPMYSTDGGATWQLWNGSWTSPQMAPGESVSILIRGAVSEAASGVIANTASVGSPTQDPSPDNNSSTALTPIENAANISVNKTPSQPEAAPGDRITYTLTVSNAGPDEAKDVTLTDAIPDDLLGPEYSLDGGATWRRWSGGAALGTIPQGNSLTVLIRGTAGQSSDGFIVNTATVSSPTPDPDPSDNTSTGRTPVVNPWADVSIHKAASSRGVRRCATVVYTILAANDGPGQAEDVTVTDILPEALCKAAYSLDDGQSWSEWTGSISLGDMQARESRSLLIKAAVSPCAAGCITNCAQISSRTDDPNIENNCSCTAVAVMP